MTGVGKSFTCTAPTIMRALVSPVMVGAAFDPGGPGALLTPVGKKYVGIWDTGATASVITEKIVVECGLKPIGMTKAHGADGEYNTEVYLIALGLPNGVGWSSLRATKGKLAPGTDMLVGMDVIGQGDFVVTNHQGRTCFSFRHPSSERIDFTGKAHEVEKKLSQTTPTTPSPTTPRVGRNAPCPCGSGKKYKRCCGVGL